MTNKPTSSPTVSPTVQIDEVAVKKQRAVVRAKKLRVAKQMHKIPKSEKMEGLYVQKQLFPNQYFPNGLNKKLNKGCGGIAVLKIGDKATVQISAWMCDPVTFDKVTGQKVSQVKVCTHTKKDAIFALQQISDTFYVGSTPKSGFLMKGIADGVRGMCQHETRQLLIPPSLAFGAKKTNAYGTKIPGNQWIYAEITLLNKPEFG